MKVTKLPSLPQLGFYCLYKRRLPGTLNYNPANEGRYQSYKNQPDCANITGILTQHAQWLTAAGVDFVVVRTVISQSSLLRLRPQQQLLLLTLCASPADAHETSECQCRSMLPTFRITTRPRTPSSCGLSRSCARCVLMSNQHMHAPPCRLLAGVAPLRHLVFVAISALTI